MNDHASSDSSARSPADSAPASSDQPTGRAPRLLPGSPPPRPGAPVAKAAVPEPPRWRTRFAIGMFALALATHLGFLRVGWNETGLIGQEFRQAQTALTAYWLRENGFSLAYETPLLGKPWAIPMEFPLYQWLAARLSVLAEIELAVAGRWLSAVSFYAMLPALYLLLGLFGLPPSRRLLALVPVLASPMYVFYTRAFLIESMALSAAVWHAWFVVNVIRGRGLRWAIPLALATGGIAALVKVTTWAGVLLPVFVYGAARVARDGPWAGQGSWHRLRRLVLRSAAATVPVLAVALWWVRTADAIKAENPAAEFLLSSSLRDFNFGTLAQRFSPEFWTTIGDVWLRHLVPDAAWLALVFALALRGTVRRAALWAIASFLAPLLVFANLYFLHDYYFYANGLFLCLAVGLGLVRLLELEAFPAGVRVALIALVPLTQVQAYTRGYYQWQRLDFPGGSGLTQAIRAITERDDVLVIFGDDWTSIVPYYSQRRALMVPAWREPDEAGWRRSLDLLADERIPLLLIRETVRQNHALVNARIEDLAMHPTPLFTWEDRVDVYARADLIDEFAANLEGSIFHNVRLVHTTGPVRTPEIDLSLREVDPRRNRAAFTMMSHQPVRYLSPYGLSPIGHEGKTVLLAHTPSEFHFVPPAGARTLRFVYGIIDEAWERGESDGFDVAVFRQSADGDRTVLFEVYRDPKYTPLDRGRHTVRLELPADLAPGDYIVLRTGPGPHGHAAWDWVFIESLEFR